MADAEALHVISSTISPILQLLHPIGVVTGEVNPADCRNRIIRMTPTAAAEVGKFHSEYMRTLLPQFAALSTRERSELAGRFTPKET